MCLQGFGLGLVFVLLNTVAFATLLKLRTEGAAMLTLVRNIGSFVGISIVIAELTQGKILAHARLVEFVTPFEGAMPRQARRPRLQGGGALGAYQAGVCEALSGSDYIPDWVAGISIGSINAGIVAGNAPENRIARLREFWEGITAPSAWWPPSPGGVIGEIYRRMGAMAALFFGYPCD